MSENINSRRQRLLNWLKGIVALTLTGFLFKAKRKKPIIMLTKEGQLVEIAQNANYRKTRKINNDEVHTWIKN